MTKVRFLIAGLTAIAAMTAAEASAQDCAEWLKWICSDSKPSNPATTEGVQRGKGEHRSRAAAPSGSVTSGKTKQARPAAADNATNPKAQQTQALKPARPARPISAMNDQEREALFERFLRWQKQQRPNAASNR